MFFEDIEVIEVIIVEIIFIFIVIEEEDIRTFFAHSERETDKFAHDSMAPNVSHEREKGSSANRLADNVAGGHLGEGHAKGSTNFDLKSAAMVNTFLN